MESNKSALNSKRILLNEAIVLKSLEELELINVIKLITLMAIIRLTFRRFNYFIKICFARQ